MNLTRYKARFAFLLSQLRIEMNYLPRGPLRADLMDSVIQLCYVNRNLQTFTPDVLDSYIFAAESVIVTAASSRMFPKQVAA